METVHGERAEAGGAVHVPGPGVKALYKSKINLLIALMLTAIAATIIFAYANAGSAAAAPEQSAPPRLRAGGMTPGIVVENLKSSAEQHAQASRAGSQALRGSGGEGHVMQDDTRRFLLCSTFADEGCHAARAEVEQEGQGMVPPPARRDPDAAAREQLQQKRMAQLLAAINSPSAVSLSGGGESMTRLISAQDASGGGGDRGGRPAGSAASAASSRRSQSGGYGTGSLDSYARLRQDSYRHDSRVEGVDTPYLLRQGTVIPAIMLSGINSDLPGQILAQVTDDVLDTPRGEYVLIPRGARLVGQYGSSPEYGAERLMMAFNRIIFPDGKAMDIGAMPGTGTDGYTGADAHVNNHMFRLFTSSVLLAGVGTTVILTSQNDYSSDGEIKARSAFAQELSETLGETATQIIQRNLNVAPTLEVYPGYFFNVSLIKDLRFDRPYAEFDDYASAP